MNFYEFAEILKKQNPNKIVFIKTGAFFNCIGKDAIIAEKQLGLKRTCFAKGICKCGMPVQYWRKHIEKIKPECQRCTNNQYYKEEKNTNKYTIEKEEFEKLKTDVKKILDNVEKLFEIFGK